TPHRWFHLKRAVGTGCVPTGPTTHTLAAYSDRLILKTKDGVTCDVQTSSSYVTARVCWFHCVSQLPSGWAWVTIPGQSTPPKTTMTFVAGSYTAECRLNAVSDVNV